MAAYTTPKTYSTGDVLTAADMNTYQRDNQDAAFPNGFTWQSFTPNITASTTDPTYGTGANRAGYYLQLGSLVICHYIIEFGTGMSGGSGTWLLDLPVTADLNGTLDAVALGTMHYKDDSGGDSYGGYAVEATNSDIRLKYSSASAAAGNVSPTLPFTWADNDSLGGTVIYRTAVPS